MTQAVAALSGAHDRAPTGFSPEVSRRSLMGAAFAMSALAVPVAAIAVTRSKAEDANAKFWRLHAELEALEAEWSACPDDDDEKERRLGELVNAKFDETMMQGVSCPLAVLAKLKLASFDAGGLSLPYPAVTAAQMIEWDLERCANDRLVA